MASLAAIVEFHNAVDTFNNTVTALNNVRITATGIDGTGGVLGAIDPAFHNNTGLFDQIDAVNNVLNGFDGLKGLVGSCSLFGSLEQYADSLTDQISQAVDGLQNQIGSVLDTVTGMTTKIEKLTGGILNTVEKAQNIINTSIPSAIDGITNSIDDVENALTNLDDHSLSQIVNEIHDIIGYTNQITNYVRDMGSVLNDAVSLVNGSGLDELLGGPFSGSPLNQYTGGGIVDAISNINSALENTVNSAINLISKGVSGFISSLCGNSNASPAGLLPGLDILNTVNAQLDGLTNEFSGSPPGSGPPGAKQIIEASKTNIDTATTTADSKNNEAKTTTENTLTPVYRIENGTKRIAGYIDFTP